MTKREEMERIAHDAYSAAMNVVRCANACNEFSADALEEIEAAEAELFLAKALLNSMKPQTAKVAA